MRLSVITPVFNGEKYIKETIDSVLKAIGDQNIEYLVIDDGSTDKTPEILENYGSKIKLISQTNKGESAAVNTGFNSALGDFVLVVSADDPLFTSDIFDGVEAFFDSNPQIAAWYPDWKLIDGDGKVIEIITVQEYSDEKLIGRFLCLPGPGAFIRKNSALKIGGRRERWRFVGDYDFWLRLSRKGDLQRRGQVLAQWRHHDESSSIAFRGSQMFDERINVITEFINEYKMPKRISKMALGNAYYSAALLKFYSNKLQGRRALLKSFYFRRGVPENFNIKEFIYLALFPISKYVFALLSRRNLFKVVFRRKQS
jgi:glycosyltransferase involved in cell wall biosynthesis